MPINRTTQDHILLVQKAESEGIEYAIVNWDFEGLEESDPELWTAMQDFKDSLDVVERIIQEADEKINWEELY